LLLWWWRMVKFIPRFSTKKHVLAHVNNELYAKYLFDIMDLLSEDPRIKLYYTTPPYSKFKKSPNGRPRFYKTDDIKKISYKVAQFKRWDLVLFASSRGVKNFNPDLNFILVKHGLESAKRINGENFTFGPSRSLRGSKPLFSRMFVMSEYERKMALSINPVLASVVKVVGDMHVDRMLSTAKQCEIQKSRPDQKYTQKVILIQSTYGKHSLLFKWGKVLLDNARQLVAEDKYKFIVTIHPNYWNGYADSPILGDTVKSYECEGLKVFGPDEHWEDFLPLADAAITDHTSLALAFALLNRPMAFIPLVESILERKSILYDLYGVCPRLSEPEMLESFLDNLFKTYPYSKIKPLASNIVSHSGRAKKHFGDEFSRLLA
jgi:hypothetical protein